MTPTVLSVMAASTASGERQKSSASMSAKTGVAPVRATELAVAAKVNDGTITSWPARTPLDSRPRCRPEVPELTATHARPRPKCSPNSRSKASHLRPLGEHAAPQHPVDCRPLLVADDRLCGRDEVVHCGSSDEGVVGLRVRVPGGRADPAVPVLGRARAERLHDPPSGAGELGRRRRERSRGRLSITTDPAATSAHRPIVTGATQTGPSADRAIPPCRSPRPLSQSEPRSSASRRE